MSLQKVVLLGEGGVGMFLLLLLAAGDASMLTAYFYQANLHLQFNSHKTTL